MGQFGLLPHSCGGRENEILPHTTAAGSGTHKRPSPRLSHIDPSSGQLYGCCLPRNVARLAGQEERPIPHSHNGLLRVTTASAYQKEPKPCGPHRWMCPTQEPLTGSLNCSLTDRMTGRVSSSLEASWSAFMSPSPSMLHIYGRKRKRGCGIKWGHPWPSPAQPQRPRLLRMAEKGSIANCCMHGGGRARGGSQI